MTARRVVVDLPEPAVVDAELPARPVVDVRAPRLSGAGAAEPRPGTVARPPGRGTGA